jgi:hypothetical protein
MRGGYINVPRRRFIARKDARKGRIGMQTKEEDIVEHPFVASAHCTCWFSPTRAAVLDQGGQSPGGLARGKASSISSQSNRVRACVLF